MLRRPVLLALALAACNEVPEIGAVAIGPAAPNTLDELVLTVPEATDANRSDTPDVHVEWSVNGVDVGLLDDLRKVPASFTAAGDVWSAKVVASDGVAESIPRVVSIQIANTRPFGTVRVAPESPEPGEALTATATFADVDDDPVETTWRWSLNGERTEYTGPTIPAGITEKGDAWLVSAVPNDGEASGDAAQATVYVGNAPPVVHYVSVGPNPARAADPIVATVSASDPDGDPIDFRYTWLVDNEPVDVIGATFPAGIATRNQRVSVWVVATDGSAASEPVRGDAWISNTGPTVASATIDVQAPIVGDTLSCVPGETFDIDGDGVTFETYWQVNGGLVGTDATLSNGFGRGDVVSCVIVPHDGQHTGAAVESADVVVGNALPSIESIELSGDVPPITATAIGARDADGDGVKVEWTWFINGGFVYEGATLPPGLASAGDEVFVTGVPADAFDVGTGVLASVVLANGEPVVSDVQLSGDARTEGQLIAHIEATDPDGDALQTAYQWTVNNQLVDAETATLDGTAFDRGDSVRAQVLVTDGTHAVVRTSGVVIIGNTPPTLSEASISAEGAVAGDVLTVQYPTGTDADGDDITYSIRWTVNGVAAGVESTFEVPELANGTQIRAHVTPSDGIDSGLAATSSTVRAHNGTPTISSVTLTPQTEVTAESVLAAEWQGSDPEGDPLEAEYIWFVNGEPVMNAEATVPVWWLAERGDEVHVTVIVTDGGSSSSPLASSPITIGNSPPAAPQLAFEPAEPEPQRALTCVVTSENVDIDGDSVAFTFMWEADGEAYVGPTDTETYAEDTVPADQVGLYAEWSCTVTAADHLDSSGPAILSADVAHGDGIVGVFSTSDYSVYRFARTELPDSGAQQAYAQTCASAGLAPISCEWSSLGPAYDASSFGALDLDSNAFDCDVSTAVAELTGWSALVSFHQPDTDPLGVCVEGCADVLGPVSYLCGEAL